MARIVKWLVYGPAALIIIVLSVSNRHTVTFSLAPLPFEIDAPLYLLLLAALLVGVILGGTVSTVSAWSRARRKAVARRQADEAASGGRSTAVTAGTEPL